MNLLGIDFEDWFHPELIKKNLEKKEYTPSVINGLDKILDLLRTCNTSATFFIVGELIEYKPEILDKILTNGHEIAFHTMKHTRLEFLTPEIFENELEIFADITSNRSKGFRAPTFSLNNSTAWILPILKKHQYLYDSSIVPVKTSMYGVSNAPKSYYHINKNDICKDEPNEKLLEFPLLTTRFLGKQIPAGGGFYLRTLPIQVIKNAIKKYEKEKIPATFYIHSWELTPELMPKIPLSKKDSFITYHNISKTFSKMKDILNNFKFTSFEDFISDKKLV